MRGKKEGEGEGGEGRGRERGGGGREGGWEDIERREGERKGHRNKIDQAKHVCVQHFLVFGMGRPYLGCCPSHFGYSPRWSDCFEE